MVGVVRRERRGEPVDTSDAIMTGCLACFLGGRKFDNAGYDVDELDAWRDDT